jgi:hypothetical protein
VEAVQTNSGLKSQKQKNKTFLIKVEALERFGRSQNAVQKAQIGL